MVSMEEIKEGKIMETSQARIEQITRTIRNVYIGTTISKGEYTDILIAVMRSLLTLTINVKPE